MRQDVCSCHFTLGLFGMEGANERCKSSPVRSLGASLICASMSSTRSRVSSFLYRLLYATARYSCSIVYAVITYPLIRPIHCLTSRSAAAIAPACMTVCEFSRYWKSFWWAPRWVSVLFCRCMFCTSTERWFVVETSPQDRSFKPQCHTDSVSRRPASS